MMTGVLCQVYQGTILGSNTYTPLSQRAERFIHRVDRVGIDETRSVPLRVQWRE
jgi:hypothetical protein